MTFFNALLLREREKGWNKSQETGVWERTQERNHFSHCQKCLCEVRWVGEREKRGRKCEGVEGVEEPPRFNKPPNQAAFLELAPSPFFTTWEWRNTAVPQRAEKDRRRNDLRAGESWSGARKEKKGFTENWSLLSNKIRNFLKNVLKILNNCEKGSWGRPELSGELCNNKAMSSLSRDWMNTT